MKLEKFRQVKSYLLDYGFMNHMKTDSLDEMRIKINKVFDLQTCTIINGTLKDTNSVEICDFNDFLNEYTLSIMEKCMNFTESYFEVIKR